MFSSCHNLFINKSIYFLGLVSVEYLLFILHAPVNPSLERGFSACDGATLDIGIVNMATLGFILLAIVILSQVMREKMISNLSTQCGALLED